MKRRQFGAHHFLATQCHPHLYSEIKMDAFHHSRNSQQNREQRDDKSQPLLKIGHYALGDTLGVGTFGKVKGSVLFCL